MSLDKYLQNNNCNIIEGYTRSCYKETMILQLLAFDKKNILEIGFNAGHSTDLFLSQNKESSVLSFDIGEHNYVQVAKKYIDNIYPNRHKLVLGDSTQTIPKYITDIKYDLIFIDGGHSYNIAKADIINCKKFSHKDTIVIMDDTMYKKEWEKEYTIGPTKAWLDGIKEGIISEISHADFEPGRGISWGKYIL